MLPTGSWGAASARSATSPQAPSSSTRGRSARSSSVTSTRADAPSAASRRSRGSSRRSTSTMATRPPRCRRDSAHIRDTFLLVPGTLEGGRGLNAPELVSVTIDGREVQVPKGFGIVEAALEAGIEIPIFCYEPRLGAPVGACRMCLCEVEGMPKPQAACTLTATDGMIVHTAQTSPKAAESQHSVLEFILVNHPLDCPVCDKGGECPLQDLTFRYGPGHTRMTFPKRTFD